jgi:hypothetical protein
MNRALPEPVPEHPDLNAMPTVREVRVTRVTPAERRMLCALLAARPATEEEVIGASHPVIEIHTDGDFPARAMSPILFVGDVPLRECHRVGEGVYRFIAPVGVELKKNARIALGWAPNPAQATPTGFKFAPEGE